MGSPAATLSPHFGDLGDLVIAAGGVTRTPGGQRPASALAVLLMNANRRVAVDTLVDAMWEDGRPRSTSTLESHLWRLRKVIEPDRPAGQRPAVLITEPGGYRLVVTADQVDSMRFEHLIEDAGGRLRIGAYEQALRQCEEAASLWRGRPFGSAADRSWAAAAVARLEELHVQLGELHVEALLGVGKPQRALIELEGNLHEHPLRERLWAQRMLASYRCGRTDAALTSFRTARQLFVDELGTEPGEELRDLQRRILEEDPDLLAEPRPGGSAPTFAVDPQVHLPVRFVRLIGRGSELGRLSEMLGDHPVVTVTGSAGTGKTRVAVEAARGVAHRYPDGVWFVDLSAAEDGEQVSDAVASAIGVPVPSTGSREDAIRLFTRDRRMLLVLDNCEHVIEGVVDLLTALRRSGPELALLITSREALEVDGETVLALAPLPVPGPDRLGEDTPSEELFRERLDGVAAEVGAGAHDLIARICRAVDGVPLAIELAAARAPSFSLDEIVAQVEADPSTLSQVGRGRSSHRATVRAAVEWSHRLLTPREKLLHRRVSVLPGPFTLVAAAAVSGLDDATTAEVLADLVHRSLLVPLGPRTAGRPSRFSQLAIVRGHGTRALAEAGEDDETRSRRDAWVGASALDARPRLGTPRESAWFAGLDDDLAAVRATLRHTLVDRPSPVGAEIMARTGIYWYSRGATLEGRRWTELAAALPLARSPFSEAMLTVSIAAFWGLAGRGDLAVPLAVEGLRRTSTAADTAQQLALGDELTVLAGCLVVAGERDRARDVLDVVAGLVSSTGDDTLELHRRVRAGVVDLARRPPADTLADVVAAHEEATRLHNHFAAWFAAIVAQLAALAASDPSTALSWSDTALAALHRSGNTQAPQQLELRANALVLLDRHVEALRIYAAAQAHNAAAGVPWPSQQGTAALLSRARAAASRADGARAWQEGAGLTVSDIVRTTDDPSRDEAFPVMSDSGEQWAPGIEIDEPERGPGDLQGATPPGTSDPSTIGVTPRSLRRAVASERVRRQGLEPRTQ